MSCRRTLLRYGFPSTAPALRLFRLPRLYVSARGFVAFELTALLFCCSLFDCSACRFVRFVCPAVSLWYVYIIAWGDRHVKRFSGQYWSNIIGCCGTIIRSDCCYGRRVVVRGQSTEYRRRLDTYKLAAAEQGYTWRCVDCGTDRRSLSFYPVAGRTVALRTWHTPDWHEFYQELASKPLLCLLCRHARDRAVTQAAVRLALQEGVGNAS